MPSPRLITVLPGQGLVPVSQGGLLEIWETSAVRVHPGQREAGHSGRGLSHLAQRLGLDGCLAYVC